MDCVTPMVSWTVSDAANLISNNHNNGSLDWYYESNPFLEAPEDYVGFVYVIHNPTTERYYIGQKLFWTVRKLPPLKGKTRKRHVRTETDWRNYWGSSDSLQADLDSQGKHSFVRNILEFAVSKGELNYLEAKLQFEHDVLYDPLAYNGIINCKIHRNHLPK